MSSSLSYSLTPSWFSLPTLSSWCDPHETLTLRSLSPFSYTPNHFDRQSDGLDEDDDSLSGNLGLYDMWSNALQWAREVRIDMTGPGQMTPDEIVTLNQSRTGVFAHEMRMLKHRARQVVTVLRTLDNQLRLCSWRVNADGSILRTGSSSNAVMDAVQQVQMVRARNYVVACRTQSGELHFSRWDVSNTGAIYLAGAHTNCAQHIQWVEMVALTPELLVTLTLSDTGVWQLMQWQLQGDDGIHLLQTSEMPATLVNSCGLALLPSTDDRLRLATLTTEAPTTLTLHLWECAADGLLTQVASQRVNTPAIAAIMTPYVTNERLSVVIQTVNGELGLLVWELVAAQAPLCRELRVLSTGISHCTSQTQLDGFILVARTLSGKLQLQSWQQQTDGSMMLIGVGEAGEKVDAVYNEVISCAERLEGNAPFLTGLIDALGEVSLTTWCFR